MNKLKDNRRLSAASDFLNYVGNLKFATILADPPWQFQNRTGKMAPEHQRLLRYPTMTLEEICAMPVAPVLAPAAHLYLWVPNALLAEGLEVMRCWGFTYKTNLVWYKTRKDGGPDGRGVGFYYRNVTELVLFGVRGNLRANPTRFTASSKPVPPALIWNCLPAFAGPAGINGATRMSRKIR